MKNSFESSASLALEGHLSIAVDENEASMITEAAEVTSEITPRVVRTLKRKKERECYIQFQALESSPPKIRSGHWVCSSDELSYIAYPFLLV